MKSVPFILLYLLSAVVAFATFAEDAFGTEHVQSHIYGTTWFMLLWGALVLLSAGEMIRRKMWRRRPAFMLHLSFVIIFLGAVVTAFTSRKGMLHLRKDVPTDRYVTADNRLSPLPFTLSLDSFRIEHYPGTEAPSDYVSYITCQDKDGNTKETVRVSMNRIYSFRGYRFYQSSFDDDMEGSRLSVNYDPWGSPLVYAGFLLAVVGALLILCSGNGEFRRLLNHPLVRKGSVFILIAFMGGSGNICGASLPVIRRAQADSLASRPVVYNDRIAPLNTLASDFVRKLYGRPDFHELTPEQVVGSWMLYPEEWSRVPILRIKSGELRRCLGISTPYAALSDLFEGQQYRLLPLWKEEKDGQSQRAKAIRETDEQVGLILMLTQGTLIRPVPSDAPRPSHAKVQAELLYNRVPFNTILFIFNLSLGFLAFGLLLYRMLNESVSGKKERCLWSFALYASTLFHASGYLLRWYIGGNIPLSNGFETMQFVALVVLAVSCVLHRKFSFLLPFGFLLSGFTLLVARLSEMNPQITPLMPVLQSPWLSSHVSLIMASYALFAFIFLIGILALFLMAKSDGNSNTSCPTRREEQIMQLTLLSRILLYPAEMMLGTGIILGAVWANVSWGSYWSWDPKEVWALIAFIVYGNAFHRYGLPWLARPFRYHLYMVVAFGVILMTYFGVNYLLGGMHSYADS